MANNSLLCYQSVLYCFGRNYLRRSTLHNSDYTWRHNYINDQHNIVDITMIYDEDQEILIPSFITLECDITTGKLYYCIKQWTTSGPVVETYRLQLSLTDKVKAKQFIDSKFYFPLSSKNVVNLTNSLPSLVELTDTIPKIWHFQWVPPTADVVYCELMISQVIQPGKTSLKYQLISLTEEGLICYKDLSETSYIPNDYAEILVGVVIHWRLIKDQFHIIHQPLFVITTSYDQVLIFDNGQLIWCVTDKSSIKDVLTLQTSDDYIVVVIDHTDKTTTSYKFRSPSLSTQPPIWEVWSNVEHIVKGDFLRRGHDQLLLIFKNQSSQDHLTQNIIDISNFIITDFDSVKRSSCAEDTEENIKSDVPPMSLLEASRALQLRKLSGNLVIEEKRRELQLKYHLLQSGMEVLEKMTLPQDNYNVSPIKDHSLINLVSGPLSLQSDNIKDHCYTIPIKVMDSWQRIIDNDIWTIGIVIKNEGDISLSNLTLWITPASYNSTIGQLNCQTKTINNEDVPGEPQSKRVKLSESSHISALPVDGTLCIVLSTSLPLFNTTNVQVVVMATWKQYHNDVIVNQCSELCMLTLTPDDVIKKRVCPLTELQRWNGHLEIVLDEDGKWKDLACHLGSKTIAMFRLLSTKTLLSALPSLLRSCLPLEVPIISDMPLPSLSPILSGSSPLQGTAIYCHDNKLHILYRTDIQLALFTGLFKHHFPSDVEFTPYKSALREGLITLRQELQTRRVQIN